MIDRLYLMRHGLAEPEDGPAGSVPDEDRALTGAGIERVRQMARAMRKAQVKVDRIVSSPANRAVMTAEITARELGHPEPVETNAALSVTVDARDVLAWLKDQEDGRLLLVGHHPGLTDLVGLIVSGGNSRLPVGIGKLHRGGVAAFRNENGNGKLSLDWIARPRLFRRLV